MIAIIAVLAAMLLPALSKAREKARLSNCIGNLKQIGMCFNLYFDAYDDRPPAHSSTSKSTTRSWNHNVLRGAGMNTPQIFSCPSCSEQKNLRNYHPDPAGDVYNSVWSYTNYGLNGFFVKSLGGKNAIEKTNQITHPSQMLMVTESISNLTTMSGLMCYGTIQDDYKYNAYAKHDTTINVLWSDTHVSSLRGNGTGEAWITNAYAEGGILSTSAKDNNPWTKDGKAKIK